MGQVLTKTKSLPESSGHNFSVQSRGVQIYNTAPPLLKITWRGGVDCPPQSTEHLAEERQMLTAGLTASICPFSLFLLCSDNGVEGTGVLCVEKVDLIACDSREEPPFSSRRAWRAISSSLILAWRVIIGGLSQQKSLNGSFSFTPC